MSWGGGFCFVLFVSAMRLHADTKWGEFGENGMDWLLSLVNQLIYLNKVISHKNDEMPFI